MAENQSPAVVTGTVEWELRSARTKAVRTFEQSELSIEGEARLVSLGRKLAVALGEMGYTLDELASVLNDEERTDWQFIFEVLTKAADYVPDLAADFGTVLLGIYPTEEDGTPNGAFETDRRFLRSALNMRTLVEMLQVFTVQNDYRRVLAPFGRTLSGTMAALRGRPQSVPSDTAEPSSAEQVVGTDGSLIDLETTTTTTEITIPD
jgi:hypothetical protein